MAIRDILVHLSEDPRNSAKIDAALQIAQRDGAHVTALYTLPPPQHLFYMGEYVPPEFYQRQIDEARAAAKKAKGEFEAAAAKQGVGVEWIESERLPVDAIETYGRAFDLLVLGQPDPDPENPVLVPSGMDVLPHDISLRAGRPILAVPYAGSYPKIGRRVMVAWNGSREATRAVHDALPFLTKAEHVTVYGINADRSRGTPGAELARHLARHGVKVDVANTVVEDMEAGEALLSAVADRSIDLLVMGAYGHSRMREVVFGGVTETILSSMTVPVLLSN
ncbi:universal stress protein [Ferrovibrio sp.]|jgi:nucleotide-binding universal stress UspA family protein|uniref:universal stress protein n=1 Tax=Ferrovibrio sp. TaxID=1917215 RepID=UPI0035AF8DA6